MTDHPVHNYIQEAHRQGLPNEEIIQSLLNAGWQMHQILEVVLEHFPRGVGGGVPGGDIIYVSGVSKHYGKVPALDNVSLSVKRGQVTALLGPNGAGKTTLVRILTTLLVPTSGAATVAGFNVVRDAQKLHSVRGLAGQSVAIDEILSGRENLEMVARLYHLTKQQAKIRAAELLRQFDLEDAADRPAKTYSGGMRRRLDLAEIFG